jgi:hypothetical protein
MLSLKVKIISTTLMVSFGYFILSAFVNFLGPLYQNPALLLSSMKLWGLVIMLLIVSLWTYVVWRSFQSIHMHLKYGTTDERALKKLDRKMRSLDVFLDVAQKEFMKRRISKQTFEDIQRIAGKKIVEIKAKKREITEPEEKGK